MGDGVVSFLSREETGQKRKYNYKKPYVSSNYTSGSEGDDESDLAENNTSPIKKVRKNKKAQKKPQEKDDDSSAEDDEDGNSDTDDENGREDEHVKPIPGAGWADAMSKILGRPAATTTHVILSKSKAYQKAKDAERAEITEKQKSMEKSKEKDSLGHEKPQPLQKDIERKLQRIATRGVVQLFNAVGKQQKLREEKLKGATTENKRIQAEKSLSKGEFLDMLKGSTDNSNTTEKQNVAEEEEKPAWNVLKDDFMMGARMKDWDKEEDGKLKDSKEGMEVEEGAETTSSEDDV